MTDTHITVVYKWTAKPGKLDELRSIYEQVLEAMKQKESDTQAAHWPGLTSGLGASSAAAPLA